MDLVQPKVLLDNEEMDNMSDEEKTIQQDVDFTIPKLITKLNKGWSWCDEPSETQTETKSTLKKP